MQSNEIAKLQRFDAVFQLAFLTAAASALCDVGLASDHDALRLRESIIDYQRQADKAELQLLTKLRNENSVIVALLQARYGAAGLETLLFRWTINRAGENLATELWGLSEDLVRKAELMFNQQMFIFENGICEHRTLFSTFLVDMASHFGSNAEQLQSISRALRVLYPVTAHDQRLERFDKSLASHLGFNIGELESLPNLRLQNSIRLVHSELACILNFFAGMLDQLRFNCDAPAEDQLLHVLIEDARGEIGRMQSTIIFGNGPLQQMERSRLRLLGGLDALREIFCQFRPQLQLLLRNSRIKSSQPWLWPASERRQLLSLLLSRSVQLPEAEQALSSLERYCRDHNILPDKLLDAELTSIHSNFDQAALQVLQKIALDKGLGHSMSQEKQVVLVRKDKLLHIIHSNLNRGALLGLLCCFWVSCGVKTAPRSEVLDLRPSLPYHAVQRANKKIGELDASRTLPGNKEK